MDSLKFPKKKQVITSIIVVVIVLIAVGYGLAQLF